jgi:steroid delta-isomerase-like uncharacterized protein
MKQLIATTISLATLAACNNASHQATPQATSHQSLISTYFKYFNNHNWQAMANMYTDSAVMRDPAYGINTVILTKADIVKKYQELNTLIQDVHDDVKKIYESGNNVIVEFESKGTGPDGKAFTLPICTIFEIENGKISKDFTYYDNM